MDQEWEMELQRDFPFMRQDHEGPEENVYRKWGMECSSGWSGIIREACRKITEKYNEAGIPIDFETAQCKEKFGRLRWYFGYAEEPCGIAAFDDLAGGTGLRFEPGDGTADDEKRKLRREIAAIVREAEEKSKSTCEICGAPGQLRDDRASGICRIRTMCDPCHHKFLKACEEARARREKEERKHED